MLMSLKEGQDAPICECHSEPMVWNREPRRKVGGRWRCVVTKREYERRYSATNKARERMHRYMATTKGKETRLKAKLRFENSDKGRKARRMAQRNRRAREREALTIPFTEEQFVARMAYWGNKCWMCGGPYEHVDHVIALALGGPHCLSNLRPACTSCNTRKNARNWRVVA